MGGGSGRGEELGETWRSQQFVLNGVRMRDEPGAINSLLHILLIFNYPFTSLELYIHQFFLDYKSH